MRYKVLLPTSGVGSRLGNLTNFTNKSLVRIGEKPALSYVVEAYPRDVEIVVTLGHYGQQVKDFLELAYPDRNFTFVWVKNYQGPTSSLICSLLCARSTIDCPFIFHACDTILPGDEIPLPDHNWLGGANCSNSTDYATMTFFHGEVTNLRPKGEVVFDAVYIGLAGIHDWQHFFEIADQLYQTDPSNQQWSDIHVSSQMIEDGVKYRVKLFPSWLDIGNVDRLKEARQVHPDHRNVLEKETESIYFIDDRVIKFFSDDGVAAKRVERAKLLSGLVPPILDARPKFYAYKYVEGKNLAEIVNEKLLRRLLEWAWTSLWTPVAVGDKFEPCRSFYFTKTMERVRQLLKKYNLRDVSNVINGQEVPAVADLLSQIDEHWLCNARATQFHGDFILDNMVVTEEGRFVLLDWRQDFAGQMFWGDAYYDLAKLNHNLIFNHHIVSEGGFSIYGNGATQVDIHMSNNLYHCQRELMKFVEERGLDFRKVAVLTALVWINMSPLHSHPLDLFLFNFGRLNLFRELTR